MVFYDSCQMKLFDLLLLKIAKVYVPIAVLYNALLYKLLRDDDE